MLLSNFEYVPLRILRRFLFSRQVLDRLGAFLPYYLINRNESGPDPIVADYRRYLAMIRQTIDGATVLEVGSGRTNSVGYLLAALGAAKVICLEPFVNLDRAQDEKLLNSIASLHSTPPKKIVDRVDRVQSLIGLRDGSVDIVFSSSVLEHVKELDTALGELKRVTRSAGAMLHLVDYRDHFFKYPYHFLQFSRATWERLLDPGDLPRWRLSDHVIALQNLGFEVTILERREDPGAFRTIKPRLAAEFDPADPDLAVTFAAILAKTGTDHEREMQQLLRRKPNPRPPTVEDNQSFYDLIWPEWVDMKRYGPSSRWLRALVDELIEEHLVGEDIRDVLDFGCGEGSTTFDLAKTLPRAQVLGVDQSEGGITCARANYRADNLCFRCEAGDVVPGSSRYDLVTCFEVLEHVETWQELTARIAAASKRYILVSFPTGRMRSFEVNVGHLRNFKQGEFEATISGLGFRPVHLFYAGFPFYSPIFRDLCDLTNSGGNSLSKGKYSFLTRRLADLIYFSFRYLSTKHRHGDQFCGLFERVSPGPANPQ